MLFISACAMITTEDDSQTPETLLPASAAETESAYSVPTKAAESDQLAAANKTPSREEVRLFQAQLKTAGFDPGPLDGMMGPKTRLAMNRLQSGCANLKDVLESSDAGMSSGMQAAKPNAAASQVPNNEEVRLLQVRLKDSGFDAGPIDGVLGAKTQSALLRLQSGCTLLKDLPWTLDNNFQTSERPALSPSSSEKQNQMEFKSLAVADAKNESDRVIPAAAKTPGKEEIQVVQGRLKEAGFDPGPIDGVLGPKTRWALQQYRTSYGTLNARKLLSGIGFKFDF